MHAGEVVKVLDRATKHRGRKVALECLCGQGHATEAGCSWCCNLGKAGSASIYP